MQSLVLAVFAILAALPCAAQDAEPHTAEPPHAPAAPASPVAGDGPQSPTFNPAASAEGAWPWQSSTLSGDWGGLRTKLSDSGVVLTGVATVDLATVMGQTPERGFVMPYLVDVSLSIDTHKAGWWEGGQVYLDFQQGGAIGKPMTMVPDYWGWDAVYPFTQDYTELSQYWYQHSFIDGALRLKLGKIDANVDFAVSYPNLQFINSAAYMPSVVALDLPTFPYQAGGFEILGRPLEWLDAKFGMFDGSTNWYDPSTGTAGPSTGSHGVGGFFWDNPGAYFLIGELNARWDQVPLPGHLNLGWFQQTGDSAEPGNSRVPSPLGQQEVTGAWGLYSSFSQRLWQPEGASSGQGIAAFGQFGWSPPSRNPSQWSIMGGGTWQGLLPSRESDTAGLMVAYAHFSDTPTLTPSPGQGEFVVEAFYNIQVTPWLGIQPDLQYIHQPSSVPQADIGGAWILTFRVSVNF